MYSPVSLGRSVENHGSSVSTISVRDGLRVKCFVNVKSVIESHAREVGLEMLSFRMLVATMSVAMAGSMAVAVVARAVVAVKVKTMAVGFSKS